MNPMKAIKDIDKKGIIGVSGEFFVAAELSQQGIVATMTLKNTPYIDILATNLEKGKTANIQVKTMSIGNNAGWRLGDKDELPSNVKNHFYVFVDLKGRGQLPEYIIIPKKVLANYLYKDHRVKTNTLNTKKGFTLIELLVVISIIGLLSSVVLASLNAGREKAKSAYTAASMVTYINALERHYIDNGYYPGDSSVSAPYCLGEVPDTANGCWDYYYTGNVSSVIENALSEYVAGWVSPAPYDIAMPGSGAVYEPDNCVGNECQTMYVYWTLLPGGLCVLGASPDGNYCQYYKSN